MKPTEPGSDEGGADENEGGNGSEVQEANEEDNEDELPPRHIEGVCDLGACDNLANWAYRDGDIYIEVCSDHAESLEEQFDSGYEIVERDSPYRDSEPEMVEHDCGGTLEIYETREGNEYRVCDSCDYAMILEHTGEKSMRVRHTRN